jgi:hypothetical protein
VAATREALRVSESRPRISDAVRPSAFRPTVAAALVVIAATLFALYQRHRRRA